MKPALVILAAGIGSRYGGLKQLEPVGPGGETIIDYSVYDARRAGFAQVVFVIRADLEPAIRAALGRRIESHVAVAYAHQHLDALSKGFRPPPGRIKPWGTGQAVLAAADVLTGAFAVANADDFYGAASLAALGEFLRQEDADAVPTYAMIGYALRDTLSETGAVSRGVCHCSEEGWLASIEETTGIQRHGEDGRYTDARGVLHLIPGDTCVSMNLWGFRPPFLDQLRAGFTAFLREQGESVDREFYLPVLVADVIRAGRARVRVLPTPERWCGVTHRADRTVVIEMIRGLIARGVYPERLWE